MTLRAPAEGLLAEAAACLGFEVSELEGSEDSHFFATTHSKQWITVQLTGKGNVTTTGRCLNRLSEAGLSFLVTISVLGIVLAVSSLYFTSTRRFVATGFSFVAFLIGFWSSDLLAFSVPSWEISPTSPVLIGTSMFAGYLFACLALPIALLTAFLARVSPDTLEYAFVHTLESKNSLSFHPHQDSFSMTNLYRHQLLLPQRQLFLAVPFGHISWFILGILRVRSLWLQTA